jgi:hypothetical protein
MLEFFSLFVAVEQCAVPTNTSSASHSSPRTAPDRPTHRRNHLVVFVLYRFVMCVYHSSENNVESNPLTPGLNPSAQRCLTGFLLGILLLEPCISLIYAWKTNKYTNYSFSLLIMYGTSYMFRHYIGILRERHMLVWLHLNWNYSNTIPFPIALHLMEDIHCSPVSSETAFRK